MEATLLSDRTGSGQSNIEVAGENRATLDRWRTVALNIVGGPGCGKTVLISHTLDRLRAQFPVNAIACIADPHGASDASFIAPPPREMNRMSCGHFEARDLREMLAQYHSEPPRLLFIENSVDPALPIAPDLGERAKIAVFSIAGGEQRIGQFAELVKMADAVVLTKGDLLQFVPFDLARVCEELHRINPAATIFEVSALHGTGMNQWVEWLQSKIGGGRGEHAPNPQEFRETGSEQYFG